MDNKERLQRIIDSWAIDPDGHLADRIAAANLLAPDWKPVTEPFDERIRYLVCDGLIVEDAYFGRGPFDGTYKEPENSIECWRNTYTDMPCKYPITHFMELPAAPKDNHEEDW